MSEQIKPTTTQVTDRLKNLDQTSLNTVKDAETLEVTVTTKQEQAAIKITNANTEADTNLDVQNTKRESEQPKPMTQIQIMAEDEYQALKKRYRKIIQDPKTRKAFLFQKKLSEQIATTNPNEPGLQAKILKLKKIRRAFSGLKKMQETIKAQEMLREDQETKKVAKPKIKKPTKNATQTKEAIPNLGPSFKVSPENANNLATLEEAQQILNTPEILQQGENRFFGPQEIQQTFGENIKLPEIPPIPFTQQELQRASELGQMLILRMNGVNIQIKDNKIQNIPFTIKEMNNNSYLANNEKRTETSLSAKLANVYKDLIFYKKDTPKTEWILQGSEMLGNGPEGSQYNANDTNIINKIEKIISYLQNEVYKNQELPKEYQAAINEYRSKKPIITELAEEYSDKMPQDLNDYKMPGIFIGGHTARKAMRAINNLQIIQLTLSTPAEMTYDALLKNVNSKKNQEITPYDDDIPMAITCNPNPHDTNNITVHSKNGHTTFGNWNLANDSQHPLFAKHTGVIFSRAKTRPEKSWLQKKWRGIANYFRVNR